MRKVKSTDTSDKPMRPALNPEARENQMIALAVDLAEQQLRDGTASSQVITHYLKLASTKEKDKLEIEILEKQKELISAKTKSLQDAADMKVLYADAIKAMQRYSGHGDSDDY